MNKVCFSVEVDELKIAEQAKSKKSRTLKELEKELKKLKGD